jgi:hypothetical protein
MVAFGPRTEYDRFLDMRILGKDPVDNFLMP